MAPDEPCKDSATRDKIMIDIAVMERELEGIKEKINETQFTCKAHGSHALEIDYSRKDREELKTQIKGLQMDIKNLTWKVGLIAGLLSSTISGLFYII